MPVHFPLVVRPQLLVERRSHLLGQRRLQTGQANVRRWVDDILPLLTDDDPLGVDTFATQRLSLEQAPQAYADFQQKKDGVCKVVFQP